MTQQNQQQQDAPTISDAEVTASLEEALAGILYTRTRKQKGETADAPTVNQNRGRTIDALISRAVESDMPLIVEPDDIDWQREAREVVNGIRTENRVLYRETPGTLYGMLQSRITAARNAHAAAVDSEGDFTPPFEVVKLHGWTTDTGRTAIVGPLALAAPNYAVRLIAAASGLTTDQVVEQQRKRLADARKRDEAQRKLADAAKARAAKDAADAQ